MVTQRRFRNPSKRSVGQIALLSVLVLSGSLPAVRDAGRASRPSRPAGTTKPPNILVIVTDDQRAGTVRDMPKTRRWFGKGGVQFARAFVTTPVCCPSRASILTGQFAHNHGVRGNSHARRLEHSTTLQRYLRQAGYTTGFAGKLLNGWDVRRDPPYFDRWAVLDLDTPYVRSKFNVDGRL